MSFSQNSSLQRILLRTLKVGAPANFSFICGILNGGLAEILDRFANKTVTYLKHV